MNISCLSLSYLAAFPLKLMIILRGATSATQELSPLMILFWTISHFVTWIPFPRTHCSLQSCSCVCLVCCQSGSHFCLPATQDYRFSKECPCHPELLQQSCSLSCCQNRGATWFGTPWFILEVEETCTRLGDSWKKSGKEHPTLKIKFSKKRKK